MLLFRSQSSLETQTKPLFKSQHNQFLSICTAFKPPAVTRDFRRVLKGGFYRIFNLNISIKKENVVYFTLVVFLLLVSLAILGSYPIYHQENAGRNISKKRHFLHVNRICNSVYGNNWKITTFEHDTLPHFKPIIYFNCP